MALLAKYPVRMEETEMSEETDPVVEIDERDCIYSAEEEVAELKAELREAKDDAKENWFVFKQRSEDLIEYKARFDEEVRGGIELQDRLDAKDEELEQAKEQIRKCHARLAKWGEILGVIKFSMRDVDKA